MSFLEVVLVLVGVAYLLSIVYRADSASFVLPVVRNDFRRILTRFRPGIGAADNGAPPAVGGQAEAGPHFRGGARKRLGATPNPEPKRGARGRKASAKRRGPATGNGHRRTNPNAPCWICGQPRTPGHHH